MVSVSTASRTAQSAPAHVDKATRADRFRPDIEGLRAIAIGTVLLYHAGLRVVPGGFVGVDVFFVISGFLITGLLVREVERTGRVSLPGFYARRAKRLLPAAALVLVVTAVLARVLGNIVDRATFGGDIVSAAAYFVNWRLAGRSVDYLAEGTAASPVQHFWSLAVEEQFYVVWPLLLVLAAFLGRRYAWRVRTTMTVGLALIVAPSLIWSLVMTAINPAGAFFVTTTRLWELGIGGLVATGTLLWRRISRPFALALGWLGLATLLASALLLDQSVAWPGYLAAAPVLGTAAVIIAGTSGAAPRVLSWRPAVWLGGISYSLYLWHWPAITAATWVWGDLGQIRGLLLVLVSVVPAWLSYRYLENPVRRSRRLATSTPLALSLGLNLSAVGLIAGLVLAGSVPAASAPPSQAGVALGAAALRAADGTVRAPKVVDTATSITPLPQEATKDLPAAHDDGCQATPDQTKVTPCTYGDRNGDLRVVVAGDSKAFQWTGVLDVIAQDQHWQLDIATKSACGFADAIRNDAQGKPYANCKTYNDALLARLVADPPDVVIVSQVHDDAFDARGKLSGEAMVDGLHRYWRALEGHGIQVIALVDNPAPPTEEYRCVADNPDNLSRCAFVRARGVVGSGAPAIRKAAAGTEGVDVVDMTDTLCNETACPSVINGVLVYRQGSHITNTYALSERAILADRLVPLVEQ